MPSEQASSELASSELTFDLHRLTARLDRAADQILQAHLNLSYRRFLALVVLDQLDDPTQRELAHALEVTEPSVSRMVGVLASAGLLEVGPAPAGGHRRRVRLTALGTSTLQSARDLLEGSFAALVTSSGVSYDRYASDTRRLIEALDGGPSAPDPVATTQ